MTADDDLCLSYDSISTTIWIIIWSYFCFHYFWLWVESTWSSSVSIATRRMRSVSIYYVAFISILILILMLMLTRSTSHASVPITTGWFKFVTDPENNNNMVLYLFPILLLWVKLIQFRLSNGEGYVVASTLYWSINVYIFFSQFDWSNTCPLDPIQVPLYFDDDITQFQLTILLLFPTSKTASVSGPLSCCCFALIREG